MNPDDLVKLITEHKWVGVAAFVIGLLVRLLKSDTVLPTIQPRYRFWAAMGFGVLSGVLEKVSTGTTWTAALVGGVFSALMAVIGQNAVIESMRAGKELPILPKSLLIPGASPAPGKPISRAPEAMGPEDSEARKEAPTPVISQPGLANDPSGATGPTGE